MDISLTFINRSEAASKTNVVIYLANLGLVKGVIAWRVIQNCGRNCTHPFVLEQGIEVGIEDDFGNYSARLDASAGQAFTAVLQASGNTLIRSGFSRERDSVMVTNGLVDPVSVNAYSDNLALASWSAVPSGCKVFFRFTPTLFIGVVPCVTQGQTLSSDQLAQITTELSLIGVRSSDIVMNGSGSEQDPYTFKLENYVLT